MPWNVRSWAFAWSWMNRRTRMATSSGRSRSGGREQAERPRYQFLSGSALAFDEDRARHGRHLLDLDHHLAQRVRLADQARDLLEAPALENAPKPGEDFVEIDRLGIDLDEPFAA